MKRTLTIALTVVAILLVAALTAMISLRLAIHGRSVAVPDLAGLSDEQAALTARRLGLNVSVENRFYSAAVAANHVLSQAPAPGARVRRGWQVRVTESLGGQHVAAPDLTGESERPALLMLSRLQLTLAPESHLPAPGPPGVVIAQSPPPNTSDAAGPLVSLLVSGAEPDPASFAYVMPRITGMSVAAATALLATAGLHLAVPLQANPPSTGAGVAAAGGQRAPDAAPGVPGLVQPPQGANVLAPDPAIAPIFRVPQSGPGDLAAGAAVVQGPAVQTGLDPDAVILTQTPAPGQRVTRADAILVGFTEAPAAAVAPQTQ